MQGSLVNVADVVVFDIYDMLDNISLHCSGGVGFNCTFEATIDKTNWFGVEAVRNSGNTIETATGALTGAPAYAWDISCGGWAQVRVRCTARTSGTQVWTGTCSSGGGESAPIIQSHPVTGSGTFNVGPAAPSTTLINSAASTNATLGRGAPATLIAITASNTNAAARFLKVYNKASAPTVGTDTPALVVVLPPTSSINYDISLGHRFSTGISFAITGAMADSDTTAIAAGEVKAVISYF